MDLINEMFDLKNQLYKSVKLLKENGCNLAQAERDYKVSVNKEVLKLRAEGHPVTLINLTVYGSEPVEELRLKRDIAKVIYDTNQEHINVTKLSLRIIEKQVEREYRG